MLRFMLCPNMGFIWSLRLQKSSLEWWCRLFVSRCCWMRSTTLSYLLILGLKRCMLCCMLVCGGHRCEFLVSKFVSNVRFINMLKIAHKHPQAYWNRYLLLREGFGSWSIYFITGLPSCENGCNAIFTWVYCLTKYTV